MKLHELRAPKGSVKSPKRKGRGPGSGFGKTAGRGHKGQKSRSGGGVRPGFEGGQMPLIRRIPKRGFTNIFAKIYTEVNVGQLENFEPGTEITPELLREKGIIKKLGVGVKILGDGELTKSLVVKAHRFSKTAQQKIEAVGGKAEVI